MLPQPLGSSPSRFPSATWPGCPPRYEALQFLRSWPSASTASSGEEQGPRSCSAARATRSSWPLSGRPTSRSTGAALALATGRANTCRVCANFLRPSLFGVAFSISPLIMMISPFFGGHFSPIIGYDETTDLVLFVYFQIPDRIILCRLLFSMLITNSARSL